EIEKLRKQVEALKAENERLRKEAEAQRQQAEKNFRAARAAVDQLLTRVAEDKVLDQQPRMDQLRRKLLEQALEFYKAFLQEKGEDPAVRGEAARAYQRVAAIQAQLGNRDQAEKSYRQALELMKKLVADFPKVPEHRQELAGIYHSLGRLER